VGDVVDDVLVLLHRVGLRRQRAEHHAEFVLAGRDLVVMLVDVHADLLHRREHLRTEILRRVGGGHGKVAALDAGAVAHVAHLEAGIRVPRAVGRVDLIGHLVHRDLEADVVEDEELGFRSPVGLIADAGGLKIRLGLLRRPARVALIGLAGVGLDHIAMQAERLFGVERIDIGRRQVGVQFHVRLVDRLPSGDRRPVEHEAFGEKVLVYLVFQYGDVLELAARVGETDVDIRDFLVADRLENAFSVAHHVLSGGRFWILGSERVRALLAGPDAHGLLDR